MRIHRNNSHGNLVVNQHHSALADVIDKAVVVGERAAFQRSNCVTLVERLRRLRPLVDEVLDSKTPVVGFRFDNVEDAVVKAKELLERCGPDGSRVYMVSYRLFGLGLWVWPCDQRVECCMAILEEKEECIGSVGVRVMIGRWCATGSRILVTDTDTDTFDIQAISRARWGYTVKLGSV